MVTVALSAGARFGRYTLLRQLAIGGMAEIYLVRIDGIGAFAKHVVLKRILDQYARSEEFVQMFLHEARLAAGLQHPNIVQVFDIGEIDGSYFFTMEYVQGSDLRTLLKATRVRGERIPIPYAIAFVAEAAAGLHYAHEQLDDQGRPLAIVHRDVSPSNIMVSVEGSIKVADFGIAKAASQTVETRTGTIKGKVAYMSPEQCRGDDLDRRSDVFSLGIVLHELVTGSKVFQADNDYAMIRKIVEQDAPRLADVSPGEYPEELERIVARALARDRDRRYATAQELQVDLDALARDHRYDGSSVARASFLRGVLGTPPSGVGIPAGSPEVTTDDLSSVPTTQKTRGEATKSTAFETPASARSGSARPGSAPGRRRSWAWALAAAAVIASGSAATWFALRDEPAPDGAGGRPAGSATTPIDVLTPTSERVPPDAGSVPAPFDAAQETVSVPVDAPSRRPKRRPQPTPASDPCNGWDRSSIAPPPEGCDPTRPPR